MKLEKYEYKNKKRKIILISISTIVLISISFLLYKTFARYSEEVSFPIMNGKVDYYGNSDIYFAFYKGDEMLDTMPVKDNEENIVFDHAECDNGASIVWNNEAWAPLVKNLSKSKTKCSLYFKEQIYEDLGGMIVTVVENGDGLYKVEHNDLTELSNEWNKTEYRYAGVNPDNYVRFNNEIWRIIGLVNVKTASGVEQRVKIVRTDGIENQKDFGEYVWDHIDDWEVHDWTFSSLKDMLNGIYYESDIGECYTGDKIVNKETCDFKSGTDLPKGLDDTARNMIDKDVIWNIGRSSKEEVSEDDQIITVKKFYERERGTITGSNAYPSEWSKETDIGSKHNGIALIYPSDYGYATNGGSVGRERCFAEYLDSWDRYKKEIIKDCGENDWLKPNDGVYSTLTLDYYADPFWVGHTGGVYSGSSARSLYKVWPTVYLTSSTKIVDGSGTIEEPYVLQIVS